MGKVLRILGGVLLGATVAIGLVLLFTPQSGAETRRMLEERFEELMAEGRRAAEAKRLELQAQFETLKRPTLKE